MSAGQALERPPASLNDRHAWLRHLLAVLVALPLLLGLAGAVVVWRLSQGPLELGFLARLIEAQANRGDAPGQLRIGSAAVGWAGFRGEAPLDIRLSGVTLRDGDGSFLGALPDGSMTLALRPLLRGVLAPSTIEMRAPDLLLLRNAEGHLAFDLGGLDELGPEGKPDATAAMLADLLRPVEDRASHTSIRSVRILGGRLRVRDAVLGRDWALEELRLDLRRAAQGGLDGDGEAQLRLGEARVPVHVSGQAVARPGGTASYTVRLDLPLLHPSALVQLIPEAAPLLFLDAPLAVQLTGAFDGKASRKA
jgi:hypothetical protein